MDDIVSLRPLLEEVFERMVTLAAATARPLGILVVLPVFTRAEIGRVVRAAFSVALLLPVFANIHADRVAIFAVADPTLSDGIRLVVLALKELAIGVVLGIVLGIPFWSIQAVGEIVDGQRGIAPGGIDDPSTKSQSSVAAGLLLLTAIVMFVSADGLLLVSRLLYESYAVWPMATFLPPLSLEGFTGFGTMLDRLFAFGLVVGGPFLILFFLTDLGTGLMSRAAPAISAFALAPIVKNIGFLVIAGVYVSLLVSYMREEVSLTRMALDMFRGLLEPLLEGGANPGVPDAR